MLELLLTPENFIALFTLVALEVVLGIDNIVFISILVGSLPPERRDFARRFGIILALLTRLLLLFSLVWMVGLVEPWFTLFGEEFSGRDLILIAGGLFLLGKSTHEIHGSLETLPEDGGAARPMNMAAVIIQIALIDMVFSLDSVITAVGLVEHPAIMVIAILVSMAVMLVSARPIGEFVENHPTFKMLALAFLILIGTTLVAEGLDMHVPRGYIYFAMAFSIGVECLNMMARGRTHTEPILLRKKMKSAPDGVGQMTRGR